MQIQRSSNFISSFWVHRDKFNAKMLNRISRLFIFHRRVVYRRNLRYFPRAFIGHSSWRKMNPFMPKKTYSSGTVGNVQSPIHNLGFYGKILWPKLSIMCLKCCMKAEDRVLAKKNLISLPEWIEIHWESEQSRPRKRIHWSERVTLTSTREAIDAINAHITVLPSLTSHTL